MGNKQGVPRGPVANSDAQPTIKGTNSSTSSSHTMPNQKLVDATNNFTIELFNAICKVTPDTPDSNIFLSPVNAFAALSMLLIGLGGSSRDQLNKVMHLDDESSSPQSLAELSFAPNGSSGATINAANAVWLDKSIQVLETYESVLSKHFDCTTTTTDFSDPATARQTINKWVEDRTNSLIKNLLPERAITELTRLVLVSSIHFHGLWETPFKKEATIKDHAFTLENGQKVKVAMMTAIKPFKMGFINNDAFGLILPYEGGKMNMVVILPPLGIKLSDFDSNSIRDALQRSTSWKAAKVSLSLPKFTFDFSTDLKDVIAGLGATDLFDADRLDLSNMLAQGSNEHQLFVSAIIHKAFVTVDEKGTEAAAATAVVAARRGIAPAPPSFHCDRPFLFAICYEEQILFVGKVMNPSK